MKAGLRPRWKIAAVVVFLYLFWAAVNWLSPLPEGAAPYRAYIQSLHPIRVYEDHGCIVAVQRKARGFESGKYIAPLVSSYCPFGGEGGFVLETQTGAIPPGMDAVVYDYHKGQPHGAVDGSQPFRVEWTNPAPLAAGSHR